MHVINESRAPYVIENHAVLYIQEIYHFDDAWCFERDETVYAKQLPLEKINPAETQIYWHEHGLTKRDMMRLHVKGVDYLPINLPGPGDLKAKLKKLLSQSDTVPESLIWAVPTLKAQERLSFDDPSEETVTLPESPFQVKRLSDHASNSLVGTVASVHLNVMKRRLALIRMYDCSDAECISLAYVTPGVVV